jgi:hypothetical protein
MSYCEERYGAKPRHAGDASEAVQIPSVCGQQLSKAHPGVKALDNAHDV